MIKNAYSTHIRTREFIRICPTHQRIGCCVRFPFTTFSNSSFTYKQFRCVCTVRLLPVNIVTKSYSNIILIYNVQQRYYHSSFICSTHFVSFSISPSFSLSARVNYIRHRHDRREKFVRPIISQLTALTLAIVDSASLLYSGCCIEKRRS